MEERPNRCLGKKCEVMLPKGEHVCPACQEKINSAPPLWQKAPDLKEEHSRRKPILEE